MAAAAASAALRKTPFNQGFGGTFHQADACWLVVVIGTNQAANRSLFGLRPWCRRPSWKTPLTNCARPFRARTSARGVSPKPWENLYTFTIRVLWASRKAQCSPVHCRPRILAH